MLVLVFAYAATLAFCPSRPSSRVVNASPSSYRHDGPSATPIDDVARWEGWLPLPLPLPLPLLFSLFFKLIVGLPLPCRRRHHRHCTNHRATALILLPYLHQCDYCAVHPSSLIPRPSSLVPHPLTYLRTLYVSTIVLLVLVPMYVKPTCREPTETTRHFWGLNLATYDVCLVTCRRHVSRHDIVTPKLPTFPAKMSSALQFAKR